MVPTSRTKARSDQATLLTSAMATLAVLFFLLLLPEARVLHLAADTASPAATADLTGTDTSHRLATPPAFEPVLRPAPPGEVSERTTRLATKRDSGGGEKTPAALLPALVANLAPAAKAALKGRWSNPQPPRTPARRAHRPRDPPLTT